MKTAIDVVVAVSAAAVVLTLTFLYRSRRAAVAVTAPVDAVASEAIAQSLTSCTAC